jgi:short-subunit dehydrogenase
MIEKKFALVTGGAKRVGAELCKILAQNNYNLIIHYNTSVNEATELKNFILKENPTLEIYLFQGDLTIIDKVNELIGFIKKTCGHLNVLINNASIFARKDFFESSVEFIVQNTNIHFTTPLILSQFFLNPELNQCENKILINMLDAYLLENTQHDQLKKYTKYFTHCVTKHSQYLLHEHLIREVNNKKLNIKIFGLALSETLANENDIKYYKKIGVTKEIMKEKMKMMKNALNGILKNGNEMDDQIFKIL